MRKLILITTIFVLGLAFFIPYSLKANHEQQILAATVMITITTPNWQETPQASIEALPIPNDEYRTMARADGEVAADGLGTLVVIDDELLLVTHDHWSRFDDALGTVTFQAADGSWLADMNLRAFKEHVRYRDGGTMVLAVPHVLETAVPGRAKALYSGALHAGDHGYLTRREGNRVVMTRATVISQGEKFGRPVVRLQSAGGQAVTGGDSGGGVWIGGRFAATMWTTVMMESMSSGKRWATDMSIAAVYGDTPE